MTKTLRSPGLANAFWLMLLAPQVVLADQPSRQLLTPSSAWNVNYADDYCRLARSFGTGDGSVVAIFDRFEPGQSFRITLAGARFKSVRISPDLAIQFGPTEKVQHVTYFTGDLGKGRPALILRGNVRFDADKNDDKGTKKWTPAVAAEVPVPISPERLAAITQLLVDKPLRPAIGLQLGSMAAPNAALDKCMDDLQARWGIDVVRHKTLGRRPVPLKSPGTWVLNDDYPPSARASGAQGIVNFRLSVDERGKPTACHIQQSTRPIEFDTAVCQAMMKRARFEPALDKDGLAIASYYRSTVNFVIE